MNNISLGALERKWILPRLPLTLTSKEVQQLLDAALEAREEAYAPYSKFKVGSAVLTDAGIIYKGSNIENASYGATICAERVAIFKAISEGQAKIKALAVLADYPTPLSPCGLCRQVASEFGKDIIVIMSNMSGQVIIKTIEELFPDVFDFSIGRSM